MARYLGVEHAEGWKMVATMPASETDCSLSMVLIHLMADGDGDTVPSLASSDVDEQLGGSISACGPWRLRYLTRALKRMSSKARTSPLYLV